MDHPVVVNLVILLILTNLMLLMNLVIHQNLVILMNVVILVILVNLVNLVNLVIMVNLSSVVILMNLLNQFFDGKNTDSRDKKTLKIQDMFHEKNACKLCKFIVFPTQELDFIKSEIPNRSFFHRQFDPKTRSKRRCSNHRKISEK